MTAQRQHHRRGAALVEMALVLPIFVSIILGIVEFGRAMMVSQLVTNAARIGARRAVIEGNSNADVQQAIWDFMENAAGVTGSSDVLVTISINPAPGNPTSVADVANALRGDLITVDVEVPFDQVSFVPGDYLNGKKLKATSAMRHE